MLFPPAPRIVIFQSSGSMQKSKELTIIGNTQCCDQTIGLHLRNWPFGLVTCPGGPLVFQGGYHPRKENHIIRSFFRTKRCTRVHHLGYQKHAKLKKKGMKILHKYVFRVCYKNLLKSYVTHVF